MATQGTIIPARNRQTFQLISSDMPSLQECIKADIVDAAHNGGAYTFVALSLYPDAEDGFRKLALTQMEVEPAEDGFRVGRLIVGAPELRCRANWTTAYFHELDNRLRTFGRGYRMVRPSPRVLISARTARGWRVFSLGRKPVTLPLADAGEPLTLAANVDCVLHVS